MAPASPGRIEDVLAPVDHSTMHERVYSQIRDAFTSGLVVPGQRIVIRKFAHSLGTSMMPVRDALRRLEAENALVALTGRNLTVPTLTSRDYEELCRIRVSSRRARSGRGGQDHHRGGDRKAKRRHGRHAGRLGLAGYRSNDAAQSRVPLLRLRWGAPAVAVADDRKSVAARGSATCLRDPA